MSTADRKRPPGPFFKLDLLLQDLENARAHRETSWRQVAKETRVAPSTYTRMRQGAHPSIEAFGHVAKALRAKTGRCVDAGGALIVARRKGP